MVWTPISDAAPSWSSTAQSAQRLNTKIHSMWQCLTAGPFSQTDRAVLWRATPAADASTLIHGTRTFNTTLDPLSAPLQCSRNSKVGGTSRTLGIFDQAAPGGSDVFIG